MNLARNIQDIYSEGRVNSIHPTPLFRIGVKKSERPQFAIDWMSMHPPPQFICWNPIFNVGVLEGCALGRWLDLDRGALKNGISTLIREDRHLWNRKQAFLRNPLCWCLDLGLPCLENCEWYLSIVNKPCSLWCFVIRNSNWGRTQWASGPGHLLFFKLCSHPDSPRTKLVVKSWVLLKQR